MATSFTVDKHADHGRMPLCPGCEERREITTTNADSAGTHVIFSCGHRATINPERGTVMETYEKEGKMYNKIDNRMYLLDEAQGLAQEKDKTIAALEQKIAELQQELTDKEIQKAIKK